MYSQTTYSLVGETLDNYVLDSYRKGLSDASELQVHSAEELLSTFENYHFQPTVVTENFTRLTETTTELTDVYKSLYKYSYANPNLVSVTRESVAGYMTWKSTDEYLTEVYDRLFSILDASGQYDIDAETLQTKLEELARNIFIYVNLTRTSMMTRFTINTENTPSFTFVELPENIHTDVYPVWYLANSLGVMPPLEKPHNAEYTPPELLPDSFYNTAFPDTQQLCEAATQENRFITTTHAPTQQQNQQPTTIFKTLPNKENRLHTHAKKLVDAYSKTLTDTIKNPIIAD